MITKENLFTHLQNIYNKHQNQVAGILIGGSFALSYIQHCNDIDIILIFKDEDQRHNYGKLITDEISNLDNKIVVLCLLWKTYKTKFFQQLRTYAYVYHTDNIITTSKEIKTIFHSYDILTTYKQSYINSLLDWIDNSIHFKKLRGIYPKWVYHIYSGTCILKNNSYKLSKQQIKLVNLLHDQDTSLDTLQILNGCKDILQKLKEAN